MDLVDALRTAVLTLRRDPDGVLPYYLAGSSVTLLGQTVLFVGAAVVFSLLTAEGRVARFARLVRGVDLGLGGPGGPNPDPAAVERLGRAMAVLVTPEVLFVLGVTVVVALVVVLLARSVATAAQIHAVYASFNGRAPLAVGVTGASRDAWRFVRLSLLAVVLYGVPLLVFGGLAVGASTVAPVLGLVVGLGLALLLLPVLLAVYLTLLFAPQAIVVDDVGAVGAVRRSLGFVRANPVTTVGFVLVNVVLVVATAGLYWLFATVSVPQLSSLVTLVVVGPFVGLAKTALYVRLDDVAELPARSIRDGLGRGARRTRRESVDFLREHPGLVGLALALFGVGAVAGWRATSAFALPAVRGAPDPSAVFGLVPVDAFLQIAVNNWLVAVAEGYAGLALGVPTAVNLLFNGVVVGVVANLGFRPAVAVALLAPHGVIEIPALAVAGAVGFDLGREAWRWLQGNIEAGDLAHGVERAFYVLLGLVPVFVLAAFVEAFVTPYVGALVS